MTRGTREKTENKLPITNYQLPITNYQLPITNYQLPAYATLGIFQWIRKLLSLSSWFSA
ncbi:hypothetical protein [Fischerella sp. NIES-3754]|uniref:hypothetical protein n=1 Tax=Fischerella sp. NIES-3754 TaxID=1752063 RepID=UPI0015D7F3A7|nr:hypothetical protein [Fischerella sp. NIES-3754]